MKVVYTLEETPDSYDNSIFLCGPTPRNKNVDSWRPDFINCLKKKGYKGVVFSPEARNGIFPIEYDKITEWENRHINMADRIMFWVPRELKNMPALTTNVEFGRYIDTHRIIYGRPPTAEKVRYLDKMYKNVYRRGPHTNIDSMVDQFFEEIQPAPRRDGEVSIPYDIWEHKGFQSWYNSQLNAGNRLDDAKVLWAFYMPKAGILFSFVLWAKMYIASEGRYKTNEFVFTRSDISCIVAHRNNEIVLIKEFRTPARTLDGFVHENPGGSSLKPTETPKQVVVHEFKEECGIDVDADQIEYIDQRQMVSTLSSHHAMCYEVKLTESQMNILKGFAANQTTFGVAADTEKTYIEVIKKDELHNNPNIDWAMYGMIMRTLMR